jgi:NAD+ synthase (glutamine-hydrolysing)
MKVVLAQINPTVGALEKNAAQIMNIIKKYSNEVDLIVFPEMALTGYPPQDLIYEPTFIDKTIQRLFEITSVVEDTPVIVGLLRKQNNRIYNTAAIIQNKKVIGFRDKSLLPTYDVFDEFRYFTQAETIAPIKVRINGKEVSLGIEICEDLWDHGYDIKTTDILVEKGADIIINISASPFSINRYRKRVKLVWNKVNQLKKHFIYCNLVGAQDELIFDGASFVMNSSGNIIANGKPFEPDIVIADLDFPLISDDTLMKEDEQIYHALSLGVKDYFRKTGHKKAVIGLSGGIDSALTAAIVANAIGPENVTGVTLPSKYSSDHSVSDSELLANNLKINFKEIPISTIHSEIHQTLVDSFSSGYKRLTDENLQARIRGNILMALSNEWNALLLNTGNKTETALGYCTMYGDMAGALGVISDLNKIQVYSVSNWINEYYCKEIIPLGTLTKPPSAELSPNQVDPFDYDIISPLVHEIVTEHRSKKELIDLGYEEQIIDDTFNKLKIAEFKRRQSAPGLRVSVKAFGIGRRYPIVNGFKE